MGPEPCKQFQCQLRQLRLLSLLTRYLIGYFSYLIRYTWTTCHKGIHVSYTSFPPVQDTIDLFRHPQRSHP